MQRREFLQHSLAATATFALPERAAQNWKRGTVAHLLPTVSHERILLKVSFDEPLGNAPFLHVGHRRVRGLRTDTRGSFWLFDATQLEPARPYILTLTNQAGKPLCDPWTLKTFPAPNDRPERLRLLIYTCAGGHDVLRTSQDKPIFLPIAIRSRLLERGLSFQPDALIAIGDHVYWDLRTRAAVYQGASKYAEAFAGKFDRVLPVFGTANEEVLKRAAGPQIAPLYGTKCRSTPVFFVQDDHDYFENDEADDRFVSFPPDHFMLNLARATQRLYYPEFLPDENRPLGLPASSALDLPSGLSESFGTLRYGQLLEAMIYDCRRFLTLTGPSATFVPPEIEAWLLARMKAPGVNHVVNIPSTPFGWSAGKWGEWYADILDDKGKLTITKPKPYWQHGWRAQHDRLLTAASAMKSRIPLAISGDLHALGETRITRTQQTDLRANPVISVLSGPVGTSAGWPSAARGVRPLTPSEMEVDERLAALEENGFILADFTPEKIAIQFFRWKAGQAETVIDNLQPFHSLELKRPA